MPRLTSLADDALIALDNVADAARNVFSPTLRFGVTGLSRSGKTVFITALVHNLIHGGRLPLFEPASSGRIASAGLQPQPDMDVPRFDYEAHVETLLKERDWPTSTRSIAELRLTINYESASAFNRALGAGRLNIDFIDYPGEWLLDLPLLALDYRQWSRQALAQSRSGVRAGLAGEWRAALEKADPAAQADETTARELAAHFTGYLRQCRADSTALSTLPPGRFLMPGDLEGSPALTFSPLALDDNATAGRDSLHAMMESRYEAYKSIVVKPFFREHFARLDRQIVLIDLLQAINAGPEAVRDLESALDGILECFNPGRASFLAPLLGRRIDRILFAATKADHLHHENHDRLEGLLRHMVSKAIDRASFAGASVDAIALSAVRATTEAVLREDGDELAMIVGTPIKGEEIDGQRFDGKTQTAVFPGDLPQDPAQLLAEEAGATDLRFVRFRPPRLDKTEQGLTLSLPHIRLDRAMQFLLRIGSPDAAKTNPKRHDGWKTDKTRSRKTPAPAGGQH